jgi:hypothetical protein
MSCSDGAQATTKSVGRFRYRLPPPRAGVCAPRYSGKPPLRCSRDFHLSAIPTTAKCGYSFRTSLLTISHVAYLGRPTNLLVDYSQLRGLSSDAIRLQDRAPGRGFVRPPHPAETRCAARKQRGRTHGIPRLFVRSLRISSVMGRSLDRAVDVYLEEITRLASFFELQGSH